MCYGGLVNRGTRTKLKWLPSMISLILENMKQWTVDNCGLIVSYLTWLEKSYSYLIPFKDQHFGSADLFFVKLSFL